MQNVLVTGGAGHLGKWVVQYLSEAGYKVSVLSTRPIPSTSDYTAIKSDLVTGDGLVEAAADAVRIIHCASNALDARKVDVQGTKNLLKTVNQKKLKQFVYISIVGVDRSDYPYYRAKLEAEQMIAASGLPYTILRATQFHSFVLYIIKSLPVDKAGTMTVPPDMKFQSVDIGEVAKRLVRCLDEEASGLLPDFGGPEVLSMEDMVKDYLEISRIRAGLVFKPLENNRYALFATGVNLCPDHRDGRITWGEFLSKTFH